MAEPMVSDELWAVVQPLLPAPKPAGSATPDAGGSTAAGR